MKRIDKAVFIVFIIMLPGLTSAQLNRIDYNNQSLFISGANLAWLNFARDIGLGNTNFSQFSNIMLDIHDHGGNVIRWWLHTDGSVTPQFGSDNLVSGPGKGAIADLQHVLDLAWEREVGLILCLWSFDMLRLSNSQQILNRNIRLLSDSTSMNTYIANALVPLVNAVRNHPAIIAWEIFNEPEGMSNEFGWSFTAHVPMSDIQRFINRCTAAIHRNDPQAQVTSGAWSIISLSDSKFSKINTISDALSEFSAAEIENLEKQFEQKYGYNYSIERILKHIHDVSLNTAGNYYSDQHLIAAGGDVQGILDFYSVHYYRWAGRALSPFQRFAGSWNLDKPLVVAEFDMIYTFSVQPELLFDALYNKGYAGALPWSWTDDNFSSPQQMLAAMKSIWNNYREDVDIDGIGGYWPHVRIISPQSGFLFNEDTEIPIEAAAYDQDGMITSVEFFLSGGQKLGEDLTEPYNFSINGLDPGMYSLTAHATDNQGHQRTSKMITIFVHSSPSGYKLWQNYPNPFNPQTVIRYALVSDSEVKLTVYDIQGRLVSTLVDQQQDSGVHQVEFDIGELSGGLYFYRLQAGQDVLIRKMMRIK